MSAWTVAVSALDAAAIPHVLIGGLALGAHGLARATRDADLLAPREAMEEAVWSGARAAGFNVQVRWGDPADPLVGVVRIQRRGGAPADVVVVGRWTVPMLSRGHGPIRVRGASVRVADAADLALLKLYAAGPRDLDDVRTLLRADPSVRTRVEARLPDAPDACREAWAHLTG